MNCKGSTMESIKALVLKKRKEAPSEEKFIEEMESLIEKEGDIVCQAFFKLFIGLDFPPYTARKNWFDIVDQRESLSLYLGRDIALLAVVIDYLSSSCCFFKNSMIVECDTFEKVLRDSRHDNLTGLFHRASFWEVLNSNIALAKRHNAELTILFIDVDDFKFFNDTYGHQAGDKALAAIAEVIRQESRSEDVAIRYGGEEFVVILPNTSEQSALVLAERIRQKIENIGLSIDGHSRSFTISGGLASYPGDAPDGYLLLNMADRALYQAKALGKNNIALFADEKQRSYPRRNLVRPIEIKKIGLDATRPFSGVSKDICMGGMLFKAACPLDVGSHIEVNIPVLNKEPLFLLGSVVRVKPEEKGGYDIGMAISFKEMEKAAKNEISSFMMLHQLAGKGRKRKKVAKNITNIVEM